MKSLLLLLSFLAITAPCRAQNPLQIDRSDLIQLENTIGISGTELENLMGAPDVRHLDWGETVWVYYDRADASTDAEQKITGYTIFVISYDYDEVSWCSKHWYADESDADAIYDTILSYMGENERTISAVGGSEESDLYTGALRLSRRGDNLWWTDVDHRSSRSHAEVLLGSIHSESDKTILLLEAERLERNLE